MRRLLNISYLITIRPGILLLHTHIPYSFETSAAQAVLMDYDTGVVMYSKKGENPCVPSSMAKIMTVYLTFERLRDQDLSLDDEFIVSKKPGQNRVQKHS